MGIGRLIARRIAMPLLFSGILAIGGLAIVATIILDHNRWDDKKDDKPNNDLNEE